MTLSAVHEYEVDARDRSSRNVAPRTTQKPMAGAAASQTKKLTQWVCPACAQDSPRMVVNSEPQ
jgi:hypothetical protein